MRGPSQGDGYRGALVLVRWCSLFLARGEARAGDAVLGGRRPRAAATVTDSLTESDSVPRLRWVFAIGCLLRY